MNKKLLIKSAVVLIIFAGVYLVYFLFYRNDVSNNKNWQTYVDNEYNYSIKYPSGWIATGLYESGVRTFKSKEGNTGFIVDYSGWSLNYPNYEETLEDFVKNRAGKSYGDYNSIKNLKFEKIVDTKDTLGYFSKWLISKKDGKSDVMETRVDFESKKDKGKSKTVVTFIYGDGYGISVDERLFMDLMETFKFK